MRVEERLLKYVSYWTTSDEECRQIPSSERQFELGKVLEQELRDLGLEKVTLTDHCYVYGLLPATKGYADKPAVGFISHMDTAPDFSGKDVKPQIIPDYDGNDVLLKGSGAYLKVSDFPTLKTLKGRTLITTDGTTLLGADDKAGVSEIMTAVEQIITEKIPHGDIWIGFTPDEEVGSGADVKDEPEDKPGRASAAYKKAFWDNIRHPGNPAIRDVLEEGTDANGGYLVPIEFEHTLVQALNENNIMRTIGCKVITTQNERKIPVANGHTQAAWTAENGAYTESNPTFAQTSIDAFKLTDLIKVSDELLSDSFFDIEGYISEEFGRAFGEAEEDAFINGAVQTGQTAIDRPTGLFIPSTAGGAPSGVTAASATAITADELISLVYSLKAPYRSKAKFLMNDATVAAIRKLKDLNGVYVWQPALTAGEPDRLLGYPLYTSPKVPTMAAGARAIAFGDFSCYWIADRAGRTIKRLNELYATNGQVGFTCTERVDGKLILSEGIKILDMKATSGS